MTFPIRVVAIADNGPEQVYDIPSLQRTELKMEWEHMMKSGLAVVTGAASGIAHSLGNGSA